MLPPSPSTPSDSSVLALHDFTYDREVHGIDYPHDHDSSQPPTPAATHDTSSPFPRRSRARAYSLSSIDHGRPSSTPRSGDRENGLDEEYGLGYGRKPGADEGHMDAFTVGEITVMTGSSLMVLGLIIVAATLTLGKVKL